jgi:hypothetical protein
MNILFLILTLISSREIITRQPFYINTNKPAFAYTYQTIENGECPAVIEYTLQHGHIRKNIYQQDNVTLETTPNSITYIVNAIDGDTTIKTILHYPGPISETRIITKNSRGSTEKIIGKGSKECYTNLKGQITTIREVNSAGILEHKHTYTYDSYNNVISDLTIDANGNGIVKLQYFYTYDELGEWKSRKESRTYYSSGKSQTIEMWVDTK